MPKGIPKDRPEPRNGRPPKLTPDVLKTICSYIEKGAHFEIAAAAAGVDKFTFYAWLRKGADERARQTFDGPARLRKPLRKSYALYLEFHQAMLKAAAVWETRDLAVIEEAAQGGDWKAAAWRLERAAARRWNKQLSVDVSVESSQTVDVSIETQAEVTLDLAPGALADIGKLLAQSMSQRAIAAASETDDILDVDLVDAEED